MLTGEIRNQVDRIWDAFWSGGVSSPLSSCGDSALNFSGRSRLDADPRSTSVEDPALLWQDFQGWLHRDCPTM